MTAITRSGAEERATKPDMPTIEIRSPFAGHAYMTDIIVSGDIGFILAGNLEVWRGAIKIYSIRHDDTGGRNPQQFKVQTSGQLWDWNDPVRIYLWTDDGSEAHIRVYLGADLRPIPATGSVTEADPLVVNVLRSSDLLAPNTAVAFLDRMRQEAAALPPGPGRDALTDLTVNGFTLGTQAAKADSLDAAGLTEFARELRELNETPALLEDSRNVLFPKRIYLNEEHARLINMHGNRNIVVSLAATELAVQYADYFSGTAWPVEHGGSFNHGFFLRQFPSILDGMPEFDLGAPVGPGYVRRLWFSAPRFTVTMPESGSFDHDGTRYDWARGAMQLWLMASGRDSPDDTWRTWRPAGATGGIAIESGTEMPSARIVQSAQADPFPWRYARAETQITFTFTVTNPRPATGDALPLSIPFSVASTNRVSFYDPQSLNGTTEIKLESKAAEGQWAPLRTLIRERNGMAASATVGADVGGPLLPSGPSILRARLTAGFSVRDNDPARLNYRFNGAQTAVSAVRIP